MPRLQLTAGLIEQIASGVRAGGYPHVSAQAWGVPKAKFDEWIAKGAKGRGKCGLLATTMNQAHAQARLRSEMSISREEARIWLEHGPGRDQPGNPGWSSSARAAVATENSILSNAALVSALGQAVGALSEHPEARQHIAQSIHFLS